MEYASNVQPAPPLPPYPYGWLYPFPPAHFPPVAPPQTEATTATTNNG